MRGLIWLKGHAGHGQGAGHSQVCTKALEALLCALTLEAVGLPSRGGPAQ